MVFSSNIDTIIKQLEDYRKDMCTVKARKIAKRLAELGVDIASVEVFSLGAYDTGELVGSLRATQGEQANIYYVVADSDHAAFVEFGTGYEGADNPYPYDMSGVSWEYMSGDWLNYFAQLGIEGWFYMKDGKSHFTSGMPARPFMHNSYIKLTKEVTRIVREVFRENG